MAPPYRKPPPDPDTTPRVGGYVGYRKAGQWIKRGLVQWIYPDGSMRVRPDGGRTTVITPTDIQRANNGEAT